MKIFSDENKELKLLKTKQDCSKLNNRGEQIIERKQRGKLRRKRRRKKKKTSDDISDGSGDDILSLIV